MCFRNLKENLLKERGCIKIEHVHWESEANRRGDRGRLSQAWTSWSRCQSSCRTSSDLGVGLRWAGVRVFTSVTEWLTQTVTVSETKGETEIGREDSEWIKEIDWAWAADVLILHLRRQRWTQSPLDGNARKMPLNAHLLENGVKWDQCCTFNRENKVISSTHDIEYMEKKVRKNVPSSANLERYRHVWFYFFQTDNSMGTISWVQISLALLILLIYKNLINTMTYYFELRLSFLNLKVQNKNV